MATLRNKRKLAAVSRETPESTRSGKAPSVLDPELTQEYISQVSEEIEGRVTKKLSKEFSRTESRILGALSKLDEFLLNPLVRTCSVVAPGTSRSNNVENQGTNAAPLVLHQGNRRRRAPQVNLNFAVRIPLRHWRQTRFCWPFSNWQRTVIQPILTTTLAEFRNCRNL